MGKYEELINKVKNEAMPQVSQGLWHKIEETLEKKEKTSWQEQVLVFPKQHKLALSMTANKISHAHSRRIFPAHDAGSRR